MRLFGTANRGGFFGRIRLDIVETLIVTISFIAVIYVYGSVIGMLRSELLLRKVVASGIDYEAFREMNLSEAALQEAEKRISRLEHRLPELKNYPYADPIGYITFSMLASEYNLVDHDVIDEKTFLRGIVELVHADNFRELYGYYSAILSDLTFFPVPRVQSEEADIAYTNTWYVLRSYGGNRRHEGTDLMSSNNLRGFFPVVSITDGVIENMGWLEKGGNRIGIRSDSGCYFYYAHLDSYASGIKAGDQVIAGQLIGFMGDSGYGTEGTTGKFDVHLHLGIYVSSDLGEMSVNPYHILKMLEDHRTQVTVQPLPR